MQKTIFEPLRCYKHKQCYENYFIEASWLHYNVQLKTGVFRCLTDVLYSTKSHISLCVSNDLLNKHSWSISSNLYLLITAIYQMSSGPNDLYGKDLLPACLWSSKIPENPFVMETKRGWHQVEDGEIKEGEKKWNDGLLLWQIAFNLKTIRERSWYLFQSRAWIPLGCFKCFKWNQSQSPEALRKRREEESFKQNAQNSCRLVFLTSLCLPSDTHITVTNHTIAFCFN